MLTKNNFWDNTQGVFTLIETGDFDALVKKTIQLYGRGIANYNSDMSAFFMRHKKFAIRVSKNWGKCGNCNWTLSSKIAHNECAMGIIYYGHLCKINNDTEEA